MDDTEVLLRVPNYDFFWQLDYKLAEPLKIPAGTTIECTGWFDNSPNNVHNPDPHGDGSLSASRAGKK
jgi:hypothetical protein